VATANYAKLGIKPGTRLRVSGAGEAEARACIGELPEGVRWLQEGDAELALLFADSLEDVDRQVDALVPVITQGGRLWVAYRKGASRSKPSQDGAAPLHRDTLQALLGQHGLQGVSLIALDDVWSALRVKPV
jgi:hypothetical protein